MTGTTPRATVARRGLQPRRAAGMNEFVSVHTSDEQPGIGTLLLSRPPTNALTRQVYRELSPRRQMSADATTSARSSCSAATRSSRAGDDVPELRTLTPRRPAAATRAPDAIDAVAAIPKPTVAAITGYALGGGLNLALAADWRVAGDNVKFGATEILAGPDPRGGGMARLARAVGASQAKDLVFSGRFIDAEEAAGARPDRRDGRPRRRLRRRGGLGTALRRRTAAGTGRGQGLSFDVVAALPNTSLRRLATSRYSPQPLRCGR